MAAQPSVETDRPALQGAHSAREPTAIDAYIGRRLRSRRLARGLTQAALAQAIGIAFQQLHKYEIGENRLSVSRLYQLSIVLDVSIMWFFEGLSTPATDSETHSGETGHVPGDETQRLLRAWIRIEDVNSRQILVALAEQLGPTRTNRG